MVVIFCSLNEQSLYGSQLIANSLMNPKIVELWGGRKLEVLVIPSRVEDRAEQKLLDKYRDQFFNLFEDFIPKDLTNMVSLWRNEIPYTPYHAFGEMVAVGSRINQNIMTWQEVTGGFIKRYHVWKPHG